MDEFIKKYFKRGYVYKEILILLESDMGISMRYGNLYMKCDNKCTNLSVSLSIYVKMVQIYSLLKSHSCTSTIYIQ